MASRKGNIESRQINCDFELTCQFSINIRKEMMPSAKVIVYHLRNKNSIYQGEITINTNELGANSVSSKISLIIYVYRPGARFQGQGRA